MKKIILALLILTIAFSTAIFFTACGDNNTTSNTTSNTTIRICASDIPHAEVLENIVKSELAKKGYTLKVTILDWTMQNSAVASGDYDANYFQHVPYLESYLASAGDNSLFATCKVHYEPLGIYYGKSKNKTLAEGKTFAICNDESNAIRAFQLLEAKGVISKEVEGDNYPINEDGTHLVLGSTSLKWTSKDGQIKVTLLAENLLVSARLDYDFALLPCNTAYTGNVSSSERIAVEDDPAQVAEKANIIAVRTNDYNNNAEYKAKIDALTDVMLSEAVSNYFAEKYLGSMTCDSSTQIDLR